MKKIYIEVQDQDGTRSYKRVSGADSVLEGIRKDKQTEAPKKKVIYWSQFVVKTMHFKCISL